ncbi:MAG: plasmid pRiA4b ORF-3 family protein [Burkholderiales bacterium]
MYWPHSTSRNPPTTPNSPSCSGNLEDRPYTDQALTRVGVELGDPGSITSEGTRLTTALNRSTLSYVYDFGDYWDHHITVEKKLAPDSLLALPFCVGGACATPPEDCGGLPGYADFVKAMDDPDDPEHEHLAEWIGLEAWDPKVFDSIEVNDRLADIKL